MPENEHREELNKFCRALRRTPEDVEYETDKKHAEVLMEECEVLGAKAVTQDTKRRSAPEGFEQWLLESTTLQQISLTYTLCIPTSVSADVKTTCSTLGPGLVTGEVVQEQ